MLNSFLEALRKADCLSPRKGFLLAVSGGADSIAMLHLFVEAGKRFNLRIEIVHLHHGLRGKEADRDAQFVRDLCERMALPFRLLKFDVRKFASRIGISVEMAGRQIRRHFFLRLARVRKLDYVAFAHHENDQAETILMNLLRGTGAKGLSGIRLKQGVFIHPLLGFTKDEIKEFLAAKKIPYLEDSSNSDLSHFRNKVRHVFFPVLEKEVGNSFRKKLAKTAEILADEEAWLESLTSPIFKERFSSLGRGVFTLTLRLGEFATSLERRLFRMFIQSVVGSLEGVDFSSIEEMRQLLNKETGKRFEFSKLIVEKTQNGLALARPFKKWEGGMFIKFPGEVRVKELGMKLNATLVQFGTESGRNDGEVLLDYKQVVGGLFLRTRRQGDFFYPPGIQGKKKLQDFLVDRKVPKIFRDRIPLLTLPGVENLVVWIGGLGGDKRYLATRETSTALQLQFEDDVISWRGVMSG